MQKIFKVTGTSTIVDIIAIDAFLIKGKVKVTAIIHKNQSAYDKVVREKYINYRYYTKEIFVFDLEDEKGKDLIKGTGIFFDSLQDKIEKKYKKA